MAADSVGAAKRRRDRQLTAFRRHEQLTEMELAAALHHSAQPAGPVVEGPREGEVRGTYDALRRLKTPLPGKRLVSRGSQRRREQSRAGTWLPGLLSRWCWRCTAKTASMAPPSLPPSREPQADEERGGGEGEEAGVGRDGEGGGEDEAVVAGAPLVAGEDVLGLVLIVQEEEEEEEEEGSQNFFLTFLWCADAAMWAWLHTRSARSGTNVFTSSSTCLVFGFVL